VPERVKPVTERMFELIKEEINIHEIRYVSETDGFVQYELKPDFKVMGPKYGKYIKALSALLPKVNGAEALQAFSSQGFFEIEVEGKKLKLTPDDLQVNIKPREGYVFQSNRKLFVALDVTLTPELVTEGYARELINKIQYTRKEQNYEIMDRIQVQWFGDEDIALALQEHSGYIKSETLTDELERLTEQTPDLRQYDINGKDVWLAVRKKN